MRSLLLATGPWLVLAGLVGCGRSTPGAARPPEGVAEKPVGQPAPVKVEDAPKLAGRWLLTLPAGVQYEAVVKEAADRRFHLEQAVRFSGLYEVQGRRFVCVQPAAKTEEGGYVWETRGPDELTLVEQSAKIKGSNYLGTTLKRLSLTDVPPRPGIATKDLRFQRGVPASELKVDLAPGAKVARSPKGLLLAVTVTNASPQEIRTTLGHEWKGAPWPPTCLYASVRPEKETKAGNFIPVYVAGEHSNPALPSTLAAGTSKEVTLRLDWPETGPARTLPLVHSAGTYWVQLLLVFRVVGKQQYVTSPATMVELPAEGEAPADGGSAPPQAPAGNPPPKATTGKAAPADGLTEGAATWVRALARVKAEYRLRKEPAYQNPVQYCLLLLGREAPTRLWLASDGRTLYVDKNGNGDLTEPGEAVPFKAEGFASFGAGAFPGHGGDVKHTNLHIAVRQRDWENNKGGYWAIRAEVEGRYPMYAFAHKFARTPADTPVIHLGGPLRLGLYELEGGSLVRGRPAELNAYVVCQYPGVEKAFVDVDKWERKDIHPVAEVRLPAKTPGAEPVTLRVPLTKRC